MLRTGMQYEQTGEELALLVVLYFFTVVHQCVIEETQNEAAVFLASLSRVGCKTWCL